MQSVSVMLARIETEAARLPDPAQQPPVPERKSAGGFLNGLPPVQMLD